MAKEKSMIVIKKITVAGGGGHGGSWKVALADFMTALMAFFLVMWLIAQNAETKKAVSDYFSTPSIIEYNFSNFGVELTLEKLFLDLVNEPLKAFQQFMEPADKTPNILDSGSQKVVAAYVADNLKELARNFMVTEDGFEFMIQDNQLFMPGTSQPNANFLDVVEKLKVITTGLEDSTINVTSMMFIQAVKDQTRDTAEKVSLERKDILAAKIKAGLENNTVDVGGGIELAEKKGEIDPAKLVGLIKISVKQKAVKADGTQQRKLERFGESKVDMSVYDNFVQQVSKRKKASKTE